VTPRCQTDDQQAVWENEGGALIREPEQIQRNADDSWEPSNALLSLPPVQPSDDIAGRFHLELRQNLTQKSDSRAYHSFVPFQLGGRKLVETLKRRAL